MLFLLLLACRDTIIQPPPAPEGAPYDPSLPGPYAVGTTRVDTVDRDGDPLTLQVWYPAEGTGAAYRYDDFAEGNAVGELPAKCDGIRPVLAFSHGHGGLRYQSAFFTERLASRGFVVVAPDHLGDTFLDEDESLLPVLMLTRPDDIADAFDWLVETDADGRLEGCLSADDGYAIAGHSFGGYTSFLASGAFIDLEASAAHCAVRDDWLCGELASLQADSAGSGGIIDKTDPRIWASVPMAPAGYEALLGGLSSVTVPTLVLGGSMDTSTPMSTQVTPLYEGLRVEPRALGEVDGAGHYSFSDACQLLPTFPDCSAPYRPPEEVHAVVNTVATAFLEGLLGEDSAAWLPPEDEEILTWTSP